MNLLPFKVIDLGVALSSKRKEHITVGNVFVKTSLLIQWKSTYVAISCIFRDSFRLFYSSRDVAISCSRVQWLNTLCNPLGLQLECMSSINLSSWAALLDVSIQSVVA